MNTDLLNHLKQSIAYYNIKEKKVINEMLSGSVKEEMYDEF